MRDLGGREPEDEGVDMLHVLETFIYCPSTHTHTHTCTTTVEGRLPEFSAYCMQLIDCFSFLLVLHHGSM